MGYQYVWHQVAKLNGTWVGGVATSKTSTTAASYTMDCIAYPYFRALNTSVTAKQAELPFVMISAWLDGNPHLEHLISDIRTHPWPVITFKNHSVFEFRTAGLDARFIRGMEYDRINFDECALDTKGAIPEILRHRLRGTRPDGHNTPRFCRLDTVSSPEAVLWFQERFEKGFSMDHDTRKLYFSLRTATWDNTHLLPEQIEAMKAELAPEVVEVEMGAKWPSYGAAYFPSRYIDTAIDQDLYDQVYLALNPEDGAMPKPDYGLEETERLGVTRFEMPANPGRRYVLAGDPGRGNPPGRNAGVVLVADVTDYPRKKLVFLHWVAGNGSIRPFLQSYKYANEKYTPERRGLDVTGTQEMLDEVAFKEEGINTDGINYSADKYAMLNLLLDDFTRMRFKFPPIQGLVRQARVYRVEDDKDIPQDLITTLAQISWLAKDMPRDIVQVNASPSALEWARMTRALNRGRALPTGTRTRRR